MEAFNIAAPRYNLARVFKTRNRLAHDDLTEFCGYVAIGGHFEDLVDKICRALPRVRRRAVWDSVRDVAGTLLTEQGLLMMSWRLSGNIELLRAGTPVPVWHMQQAKEWMPVHIQAYEEDIDSRKAPGGNFRMRVLAGTACPTRITKFWTRRFCKYIAVKMMGYTRRSAKSPLSHITELVSLRLWVQIDPELCRLGEPGFDDVGMTSGLENWNRGVIRKRYRRDWRCPYEFDHRCHRCPVGYDQCPAATHKETLYDDEAENSGSRDGENGNDADGVVTGSDPGSPHVLAGDLQSRRS